MLYQEYYRKAQELMALAIQQQSRNIERAAEMLADCIARDGIIHVFGCGHSHMMAEEMFYRAGGLAPVSAILHEDLMLHSSAVRSSALEQTEGLSPALFHAFGVTKGDLMLVVSTSGVNPAPMDMALTAQAHGIPVIGISSFSYENEAPRHSSGKKLYEVADLFLDNKVPLGDACVQPAGQSNPTGPVSTLLSGLLLNCIVVQTVQNLCDRGLEAPVYQSGNLPGGGEVNQALIRRYRSRVKLLDPDEC